MLHVWFKTRMDRRFWYVGQVSVDVLRGERKTMRSEPGFQSLTCPIGLRKPTTRMRNDLKSEYNPYRTVAVRLALAQS